MPASVGAEIAESRRHHPHEAFAVGAQGCDLDVGAQFGVAAADARRVEIDVHAAEPFDQPCEMFRGVVAVDVQRFDLDLFGSLCPECVEGLPAASRRSDPPSLADAEPCRFEPDARRGSYDDDAFHSGSIFRVSPGQYTKGMPEKQIFGQMKKSSGESSLSRYRFLLGFGFSRSGGASSAARCSAVSRAGAMRRR